MNWRRKAKDGKWETGTGKHAANRSRVSCFSLAASLLFFACLSPLATVHSQDRIRQQRAELEMIRRERSELERQAKELATTAHDLTEEVNNIDRRADATARIVRTLDTHLDLIAAEVNAATINMARAEAELAQKRDVLRRRVVDIYKRGPLYTAQALLSAPSFGQLVARYKYLHLLALRDRSLVRRVEQLRNQVALERDRLYVLQRSLRDNREQKQLEEERLRSLEQEQRQQLSRVRREARLTEDRLTRVRRSEAQLSSAIASLEVARRRSEASRPAAARSSSSVRTTDYGQLDWPVQGPLVYTFGRAVQANNTAIRWNGVGIQAAAGAGVKSVAPGRVVSVRQLGTYGLTIIVDHGGGDYTIYGSLARADVREGQSVIKGQVIGGVGISDPELPPHLHFEVRQGGPAIDPAKWLRGR
jgi:septal ring factor EnvC (AmiA/AmiB activator)